MNSNFPRVLSLLRKEKGISQKKAAQELGVSQSLLSHYEKGIRECGLLFVVKAAEYYEVSCDYLLGKSPNRKGTTISIEELTEKEKNKEIVNTKTFNIIYKKKILFCSLSVLIDLLSKTKSDYLAKEVFSFLYLAVYRMFRAIFRINKNNKNEMFAVNNKISNQLAQANMTKHEALINLFVTQNLKQNLNLNSDELLINSEILEKTYPQNSNAILNLIKNCENLIKDNNSNF